MTSNSKVSLKRKLNRWKKLQRWLPKWRLCFVTLAVTVFVVLPAAYQNTIINQPQAILMNFTNLSISAQFSGAQLTPFELKAIWGVIASASGIAAIPAALCLPLLTDRFGVKDVLFIGASLCNILCPVLECVAKYTGLFELFVLGQVIGPGIGWTIAFGLAPVYLSEISPKQFRGLTGSYVSFGFYAGIALSFSLGSSRVFGSQENWGIYAVVTAGFAVLAFAVYPFVHHSPKHSYLQRQNAEAATKTIRKHFGKAAAIAQIFQEFEKEAEQEQRHVKLSRLWTEDHLRKPLLLAIVSQVYVFCCGPMVFMSFGTSVFAAFLSLEFAQLLTIVMAAPLPLISLLSSMTIERFKRRTLLLGGGYAMVVCLVAFVSFAAIAERTGAHWCGYVAVTCIIMNVWISPFGPLSIGMFLMSELTSRSARTIVPSICMIFSMLTFVSLHFAFPTLQAVVGHWTVLILLVIPSLFCLAYLKKRLPETKGKSVSEIAQTWAITPLQMDSDSDVEGGSSSRLKQHIFETCFNNPKISLQFTFSDPSLETGVFAAMQVDEPPKKLRRASSDSAIAIGMLETVKIPSATRPRHSTMNQMSGGMKSQVWHTATTSSQGWQNGRVRRSAKMKGKIKKAPKLPIFPNEHVIPKPRPRRSRRRVSIF